MLKEIKNFFHFHKREKKGILFLIIICFLLTILYELLPFFIEPQLNKTRLDQLIQLKDSINRVQLLTYKNKHILNNKKWAINESNFNGKKINAYKPFYFNPNTVSESELNLIGLNKRFIKSFLNYRNKGKKFNNLNDFNRVFGLKQEEFEAVKDFITFPENKTITEEKKLKEIIKREEQIMVDINTADTITLMKLKGIGPAFARRIANYRNKLGGFYKKEQLMEVWGIDTSLFQFIEPYLILGKNIRKIDLNKVEISQLKNHPYLNYNTAQSIIQIRNRIGHYNSIEDIKKSVILKSETFEKLKPYLTISKDE
jgi:competence protein ComEA